jgi:hypothetical protein
MRLTGRAQRVITGELKSKIDRVWDAFWSGGISNPRSDGHDDAFRQCHRRARVVGKGTLQTGETNLFVCDILTNRAYIAG